MLGAIRDFLKKSVTFIGGLSKDPRIPAWDKAMLAAMLALLVSPVDLISDFIPVLGQLDDLVIAIVILDYMCNRLPEAILLNHYPWDPAGFKAWRRRMGFLTMLVPAWIRNRIWATQEAKVRESEGQGEAAEPSHAESHKHEGHKHH